MPSAISALRGWHAYPLPTLSSVSIRACRKIERGKKNRARRDVPLLTISLVRRLPDRAAGLAKAQARQRSMVPTALFNRIVLCRRFLLFLLML